MKHVFLITLVGLAFTLTAQANEYRCLSGNERTQVKAAVQLALSEFSQARKTCRVLTHLVRSSLVNTTYQGSAAVENLNGLLAHGNTQVCLNANGQPIIQIADETNVYMITSSPDQRSIVSIDINRIRTITVNNGTLINPQMAEVSQVFAQTKCE